jgi:hypothetical protein
MEEHDKIADGYEEDADRMEELTDRLGQDAEEARSDWDGKKKTESVPGAVQTPEEIQAEEAEDRNEFELEESENQP